MGFSFAPAALLLGTLSIGNLYLYCTRCFTSTLSTFALGFLSYLLAGIVVMLSSILLEPVSDESDELLMTVVVRP